MTGQIQPTLTIADLVAIPDDGKKYELIEGEIYVSAPSLVHQITLRNLLMALGSYLTNNPMGIVVPGPGVIFDDFNSVIPDVVFVRNERRSEIASGDWLNGAPDLVVEIISPGAENERRDRVLKRRVYGRFGVKEFWLVDLVNKFVEVCRLGEEGLESVAVFAGDDELTSQVLTGLRANVADLFRL